MISGDKDPPPSHIGLMKKKMNWILHVFRNITQDCDFGILGII